MRPKSIVTFERLVLLGIVLGIISAFLAQEHTEAALRAQGTPLASSSIYAIQGITILLYLVLLWFISRKGSPVAKWIYVVLAGLGLVLGLVGIQQTLAFGTLAIVVTLASYVLTAVTIWLLFRPDAKAWFNDGRGGGEGDTVR